MDRIRWDALLDDEDSLRLMALGRIPRCVDCPRYRALVDGHQECSMGRVPRVVMPAVPGYCHFQVCAPMAARLANPADAA
jgi:hypothetical protein